MESCTDHAKSTMMKNPRVTAEDLQKLLEPVRASVHVFTTRMNKNSVRSHLRMLHKASGTAFFGQMREPHHIMTVELCGGSRPRLGSDLLLQGFDILQSLREK